MQRHCRTDVQWNSVERLAGYRRAMKAHQLTVPAGFIAEGNFLPDAGYQATLRFFAGKGPKPSAIFCANDEMALGALDALRSLHLRCPQEVAVMGFDGIDVGNFTHPRLTTVRQPTARIAEAGLNLLIDLIEKKVTGPLHQEIESELLLRDSV